MKVNSYDKDTPRPKVGSRWVWEIDSPESRELIEVTNVFWNGEEWWVKTKSLLWPPLTIKIKDEYLNDLSRFWEACVPVLPKITGRLDQFTDNGPVHAPIETT